MTFEMITLSKQMVSTAWFQMLIGGGGGEKKKKKEEEEEETKTNIDIVLAFRTLSMFVSVSLPCQAMTRETLFADNPDNAALGHLSWILQTKSHV